MAKDIKELLGELYTEAIGAKFDGYHVLLPLEYMPKDVYNAKSAEADLALKQKEELEAKITTLSKSAEGNEELTKMVADLKKANDEQKLEFEKAIYTGKLNSKVDLIIAGVGTREGAGQLVRGLLDDGMIKLKDGEVAGINEQLERIKIERPYLFGETKIVGEKPGKGASPTAITERAKLIERYNTSTNPREQFALLGQIKKLE